jgi:hypothetical protein
MSERFGDLPKLLTVSHLLLKSDTKYISMKRLFIFLSMPLLISCATGKKQCKGGIHYRLVNGVYR